jgi:Transglutaminase-like superfamily
MRRFALIAEAFAALALASMLIGLFRFRKIAALAAQARHERPGAPPATARDIGWAVAAWARRVPWRAVCFQQGLAAQLMLRRRGWAAALHYGARHDDHGKLVAHVWVRSGELDVIGCEGADAYGLLAVFPPMR